MNTKYKQLEEALLKEADLLIEKAKSQGEKALYNLFKSAILKKYKDHLLLTHPCHSVTPASYSHRLDYLII